MYFDEKYFGLKLTIFNIFLLLLFFKIIFQIKFIYKKFKSILKNVFSSGG